MLKAFIITLTGNETSTRAAEACVKSIESTGTLLAPETWEATTPEKILRDSRHLVSDAMKSPLLMWSWPMDENQNGYDLSTGLFKKCYRAVDQHRVQACAISHARLWKKCYELNEPIVVLEHDAIFTRKFDPSVFDGYEWEAIGLNDPRGATRKSKVYFDMIVSDGSKIQRIPDIDGHGFDSVPNGLAGNSAYMITPKLAKRLLDRISENGLWPNDALMCKQLYRGLRVCYPFFTTIQGTQSTTTGI